MFENKIIDVWSAIHFLVCFNLSSIIKKREVAYPLFILYELLETPLFVERIPVFKSPEGPVNVVSDIIVNLAAYELGRKYGNKKI